MRGWGGMLYWFVVVVGCCVGWVLWLLRFFSFSWLLVLLWVAVVVTLVAVGFWFLVWGVLSNFAVRFGFCGARYAFLAILVVWVWFCA